MKTRLLICSLALLALIAGACGSDTDDAQDNAAANAADQQSTDAEPTQPPEDSADDASGDDAEASGDDAEDSADDASGDDAEASGDDAENSADDASADDAEASGDDADVPERIISLNPTATEMLFAIGAGDQVIAVDQFSYFPPEAPVTDLSGFDPNFEAIAGFEPDLVVTESPLEGLDAIGVDNVVLAAATDLSDIYSQIEQLGALTGHVGEAAELVVQMQTDIDETLASVPDREVPLTYFHELDNTLYSVTSSTFIGYVYDLFGLRNIADPADADGSAFGYPQLNEEFIIDANPDIIFLADTLCCEQTAETVAERPGWDQISAVQNNNVVELNDDVVSRWGPRIVEFIQAVGAAVNEVETAPAG